ncbi:MAG TPA: hypothetical protein EYP87_05675, partial [Flavobacteriaceae bacterium]|nr:hypothetical protein [Flavobacteriaceae bacterium]
MKKVSYKYRQFLFFLIKLSIVLGAFYFIFQKTVHNNSISLSEFILQLEKIFTNNYNAVFILLSFTFFNWFFEILKWKNLVAIIKNIPFIEALKQSLGSLTASLFTPNRIGEYGAKAFYFYKEQNSVISPFTPTSAIKVGDTLVFSALGYND